MKQFTIIILILQLEKVFNQSMGELRRKSKRKPRKERNEKYRKKKMKNVIGQKRSVKKGGKELLEEKKRTQLKFRRRFIMLSSVGLLKTQGHNLNSALESHISFIMLFNNIEKEETEETLKVNEVIAANKK